MKWGEWGIGLFPFLLCRIREGNKFSLYVQVKTRVCCKQIDSFDDMITRGGRQSKKKTNNKTLKGRMSHFLMRMMGDIEDCLNLLLLWTATENLPILSG